MGVVVKVSGPLVVAEGLANAKMYDVVRVGKMQLIGEIIELKGELVSIQVYEETSGVGPGEPVVSTNEPLSVLLGPGMIEGIFDGIQRPLTKIQNLSGDFIARGISVPALDTEKRWQFEPTVQDGVTVNPGQVIGYVQETELVRTSIMLPPNAVAGTIKSIKSGMFNITEVIATIQTAKQEYPVYLAHKWPIRKKRPIQKKLAPTTPLTTGQRIIDTLFPIAKGGTACIPGPFGSGKTVVQHQLAKWADADIIVYVGCGERGNEMTDVLMEFPHLKDPKSGQPLMKRTVLIANTSNMPVAAREASVYTGITIAEYYRDMGYSVAMMADSTSRWAEALREMSGRLEEMPGEEGYPAYLGSRIAEFYERAGSVQTLQGTFGTLSVIGAVSPPGGDLSEPVTQNTLRVAKVFWGLDSALAYARHFPAINWLKSYSLYVNSFNAYYQETLGENWVALRTEAMSLLQQESDLQEMVRLVGMDALSQKEQLVLETAKSIREDFLHQVAFDDADTYTSLSKQAKMLAVILQFYTEAQKIIERSLDLSVLFKHPIRMKIARVKYIPENNLAEFDVLTNELMAVCAAYTGE